MKNHKPFKTTKSNKKKNSLTKKYQPKNYQYYLFDLDNTLIDTKIYTIIYQPILTMIQKKKSLPLTQLHHKAALLKIKKNASGNYDTGHLCKSFNLLPEYYHILKQHLKKNPTLKQHVLHLFKSLNQQHKTIGIVSNSMTKTIQLFLKTYNLTKYVTFIYTQENAKLQKSHPFFWKKLSKSHHLKPSQTIIIGDNPKDDFMLPQRLGFHTFLIMNDADLLKIK